MVRRVERTPRAPECSDHVAQSLRADAGNERQRQRCYDFSVFHRTSRSSGIPCLATAEIVTTGAPPWVRNGVRRATCGASRSAFVITTTCGLLASSFEYDAASRLKRSYVACWSGLSIGTQTACARVRA